MSGCDLCPEARASSARGVVVECACGEVYERGRWVDPSPQASADASPSGPVWPERGTAELVYHADPDAPMERRPPSALVPVASLDPDAKLRALLSELRPDRDGPYGWAPDGVVEAIEGENSSFLVGVQCHPEEMWDVAEPRWARVFQGFVEQARGAAVLA